MNAVIDEILATYPQLGYIGEDVVHRGYYVVTEGLVKKSQKGLTFLRRKLALLGNISYILRAALLKKGTIKFRTLDIHK